MRKDGTQPLPTTMSNMDIRKYDPFILLDFYESRLKFNRKSSSQSFN